MTPTLKPRPRTGSDSIGPRRRTPPSSVWMRRAPFRRWIGSIPSGRFPPGGPEWHGFACFRPGTLSLYAALETQGGELRGQTARHPTRAESVGFLADIIAAQPAGQEIHVIAGPLSAHKAKRVEAFLTTHANVRLHGPPAGSSWLNQVENWFAQIQRQVMTRGVFRSRPDLRIKLLRDIRHHHKTAPPIQWT